MRVRTGLVVWIVMLVGASGASAASFTVNSSDDVNDGTCNATHCSLREAVNAANAVPAGPHTISFAIPGTGVHTIKPSVSGAAYVISAQNVTIDGFSQPGWSSGTPVIEIDGINMAGRGFYVSGAGTLIRGLIINDFKSADAITLVASATVQGCWIGLDSTGSVARPNLDGIQISASGTLIGGTTPTQRNVISGATLGSAPDGYGIQIGSASDVHISGNYIGTDATGGARVGNRTGIVINDNQPPTNVVIGGDTSGERNIISGNTFGITTSSIPAYRGITVKNNWIGIDATGSAAIGGQQEGIHDPNGVITRIESNVISGHNTNSSAYGMYLQSNQPNSAVSIVGNLIGTDATGTFAIPNNRGLSVSTQNFVVGGGTAAARNIISGNIQEGINLEALAGSGTSVRGNYIGVNINGAPLGNGLGINAGGSDDTGTIVIGGAAPGLANVIAFNAGAGIAVINKPGVDIQRNIIKNNGGLGIDISANGIVEPNDLGDPDTGPNDKQNFPILTVAPSGASVSGTLNTRAQRPYTIDVYSNTACDPSGNGEGEFFVGTTSVTTNAAGDGSFTIVLGTALTAGIFVTAVARDASVGVIGAGNTSEFAQCVRVPSADVSLALADNADPIDVGGTIAWSLIVGNSGPDAATSVVVTHNLPGGVTFGNAVSSQGTCSLAGSTVTCTVGTLGVGAMAMISISGTATVGGILTATASVASDQQDPDAVDRSASADTRVNRPPTATGQAPTTAEDTPLGVTLAGSDPDNDSMTLAVVTNPTHGTLSGTVPNLTYTPAPNYNGGDSFTFTAFDGRLTSAPATVSITVSAVNDLPVATADAYTGTENITINVAAPGVLANDSDAESTLLAVLVTPPTKGTLTLNADGSFTYVPTSGTSGTDTFVYKASDGSAFSANTTVTLTIDRVNTTPTAIADTYTVAEDSTLSVTAPSGLLSNDSDLDGDPLTASLVANVNHGVLSLDPAGAFMYTPAANFTGDDAFTYHASDATTGSSDVTVTIHVTPINDLPTAPALVSPDDASVLMGDTDAMLAWEPSTDVEGDALTYHLTVGTPDGKRIELTTTSTFYRVPGAELIASGVYTWTVTADDGSGNSPASMTRSFVSLAGSDAGGCCDAGSSGAGSGCLVSMMTLVLMRRRRRRTMATSSKTANGM